MVFKYCSVLLINLILLNHVSGHRIIRNVDTENENVVEESDRLMISQTGCKFLSLVKDQSVLFTKNSGNLEHTTMALVSDEVSVDQKPKFGMNFAVQSASDFHVLMFTRQHYGISQLKADYDIALGTNNNEVSSFFYTTMSERYENFQSYDLKNTSHVLSTDKYEKFYITINDGTLKYGKHCELEPITSTNRLGFYRPEIVQIGFQSKAENGAKILYDCPPNFAGCRPETA